MIRKNIVLILILICSFIVRISILDWGLPDRWNSRFSYNIDESTYLAHCANLNLATWDFDPDIGMQHPHLSTYYTAACLLLGQNIGLYELPASKLDLISFPDNYGKIIRFQRVCWGLLPGLLFIIISYLIGKQLKNRFLGILMATGSAFCPTFLINGNYAVENIMVVLLFALTYLFLLKWMDRKKKGYLYLAGISLGLCCAFKLTGVVISIMILITWLYQRNYSKSSIKDFLGTCFLSFLTFCVLSPYYLLNLFRKNEEVSTGTTASDLVDFLDFDWSFIGNNGLLLVKVTFIQVGGLLFIFGLLGLSKKRLDQKYIPIYALLISFYLISAFVNIVMGSRLTPVAFAWTVLGTGFIADFYERNKGKGKMALSGFLISLGIYTFSVINYFTGPNARGLSSNYLLSEYATADSLKVGVNLEPSYGYAHFMSHQWTKEKFDISFFDNIPKCIWAVYDQKNRLDWLRRTKPNVLLVSRIERRNGKEAYEHWQKSCQYDGNYYLAKIYPKYDLFGLNHLTLCEWDLFIYRRIDSKSEEREIP